MKLKMKKKNKSKKNEEQQESCRKLTKILKRKAEN